MSNKTRLQTNNTNLQSLINKANALPDAGSGGGGAYTVSVTVKNNTNYDEEMGWEGPIFYWDENKTRNMVAAGVTQTVNALNGVLFYRPSIINDCTGDYVLGNYGLSMVAVFFSDGGTLSVT